ncbi:MAG: hypothetical protein NC548_11145 [Lachnospiraceae bacterium]|nr:hypothetical protein [Lachnospiraceae bacterium]
MNAAKSSYLRNKKTLLKVLSEDDLFALCSESRDTALRSINTKTRDCTSVEKEIYQRALVSVWNYKHYTHLSAGVIHQIGEVLSILVPVYSEVMFDIETSHDGMPCCILVESIKKGDEQYLRVEILNNKDVSLHFYVEIGIQTNCLLMPISYTCTRCQKCETTTIAGDPVKYVPFDQDCFRIIDVHERLRVLLFVTEVLHKYYDTADTKQQVSKQSCCVNLGEDYDDDSDRIYGLHGDVTFAIRAQSRVASSRKSPCQHQRRAFYRVCKGGTYKLIDGEYINVGKGNGTHTAVRSCLVNVKKDNIKITEVPV